MRATITRKMIETKIHGYSIEIQEGGEPVLKKVEPVTTFGNVSEKEAKKLLSEAHPEANSVTVGKIESTEVHFEITVEDFVKNAKRVEPKNEEKEGNE